jgi:hypothetical protein
VIGWTERGTTVHAVVNHLHFKEPVDPDLFRRMETEVGGEIKSVAGFRGLRVVLASERHVILVIFGDTGQTLDDLATLVGNTWMRTNVGPLLERPPERHLGAVIASIAAGGD